MIKNRPDIFLPQRLQNSDFQGNFSFSTENQFNTYILFLFQNVSLEAELLFSSFLTKKLMHIHF